MALPGPRQRQRLRDLTALSRAWDWFHLNSIDPEPNGNIFISARNTWAGYQIDGATGRILWTLGGLASSFKMGPGTQTAWQHDGRILPDGQVTFFDDGSDPPELNRGGGRNPDYAQGRGVRIALDLSRHTATLVAAYDHPASRCSLVARATSRRCRATTRSSPLAASPDHRARTQRDGAVRRTPPYDMIFYRAYRAPWSGQPATRPAVAAISTTSARRSCA